MPQVWQMVKSQTRTAESTASTIGIGRRKVEESRTVLTDPQIKEEVRKGKLSIHAAAQKVKSKRPQERQNGAKNFTPGQVTLQLSRGHAAVVLRILRRVKPQTAAQATVIRKLEKILKL